MPRRYPAPPAPPVPPCTWNNTLTRSTGDTAVLDRAPAAPPQRNERYGSLCKTRSAEGCVCCDASFSPACCVMALWVFLGQSAAVVVVAAHVVVVVVRVFTSRLVDSCRPRFAFPGKKRGGEIRWNFCSRITGFSFYTGNL